jgi:hypothetical protein
MAKSKKVRRVRKPSAVVNGESQSDNSKTKTRLSSAEQFRLEYAYVLRDLRQVLVLAAIMFALLIALNLFLQ